MGSLIEDSPLKGVGSQLKRTVLRFVDAVVLLNRGCVCSHQLKIRSQFIKSSQITICATKVQQEKWEPEDSIEIGNSNDTILAH